VPRGLVHPGSSINRRRILITQCQGMFAHGEDENARSMVVLEANSNPDSDHVKAIRSVS
jgi:hypothetical protein